MSLFSTKLRFLSLSPKINVEQGKISITNSSLIKFITLFLDYNHVEIFLEKHKIRFKSRILYFFNKDYEVDFNDMFFLEYDYHSTATSFSFNFKALDSTESFKIYLVTKDKKRHFIASFRGEGSNMTGAMGVLLYGDSLLDFSGTQEDDSRSFVDVLLKVLQLPLGEPILNRDYYKKRY